jgi:succinyl-diaminopimelate desuccinylase
MLGFLNTLPLANPEEKEAIAGVCKLFPHGEFNGASVNLAMQDAKSGALTLAFSVFSMENGKVEGKCDIRFPVSGSVSLVETTLSAALQQEGYTLIECRGSEPHETPEDGAFVQTLLKTFHEVTGKDAYCVAIGGGTYVHHEEGGVAFGAEFPDAVDHHMHGPDEFIEIRELVLNAQIFAQAILNLQEI